MNNDTVLSVIGFSQMIVDLKDGVFSEFGDFLFAYDGTNNFDEDIFIDLHTNRRYKAGEVEMLYNKYCS